MSLRRKVRFSSHWSARLARWAYYAPNTVSVPLPMPVVRVVVSLFLVVRGCFYFLRRVFLAEPFFKAQCARYGSALHTGIFLHWIQGKGEIIAGRNVTVDGKCSFSFAARYAERPRLVLGDNTGISHGCSFTVGKEIIIGRNVRIASDTQFFDAPGHSSDAAARIAGEPAPEQEVRPIRIDDNVWIGRRCVIFPGVHIGANSIIATGSAVMTDVPANAIYGGNPAREMGTGQKNGLTVGTDALQEIISIVCEIGKFSGLSPRQDFYSEGLSSMASVSLMIELESRFEIVLPDDAFINCRTAEQLAALVREVIGKQTTTA